MRGAFTGAERQQEGAARGRREGHDLPRRDRRDEPDDAGEAAARAAGAAVPPRRRPRGARGRHPRHRRHQPGPDQGRSPTAGSARTCSTASTSSRFSCRRCASAARTSRCWPSTSWPSTASRWGSRSRHSRRRRWICSSAYDWPGNIRELENVIERAVALESTPTILPDSLPGTSCGRVPKRDRRRRRCCPTSGFDLEAHVEGDRARLHRPGARSGPAACR